MKIKTAELEGAALDYCVALSIGARIDEELTHSRKVWAAWGDLSMPEHFSPSTSWSQGGPLIAGKLDWVESGHGFCVHVWYGDDGNAKQGYAEGDAFLLTCMRAIVAAELGPEVDVPEELA